MNIYFIAITAIICFHMLRDHIIPDQLLIAAASICMIFDRISFRLYAEKTAEMPFSLIDKCEFVSMIHFGEWAAFTNALVVLG